MMTNSNHSIIEFSKQGNYNMSFPLRVQAPPMEKQNYQSISRNKKHLIVEVNAESSFLIRFDTEEEAVAFSLLLEELVDMEVQII